MKKSNCTEAAHIGGYSFAYDKQRDRNLSNANEQTYPRQRMRRPVRRFRFHMVELEQPQKPPPPRRPAPPD